MKHNIRYSTTHGWLGITPEVINSLHIVYPQTDIERELQKMHLWIQSDPLKNMKSNWFKFIVNWLARSEHNDRQRHQFKADRDKSKAEGTQSEYGRHYGHIGRARKI